MRHLVVGLDGTEAARVALDWAADTVAPDGRIHAIVAIDPALGFFVDVVTGDRMTYLQVLDRDLASEWTKDARARVTELTADLVETSAPAALTAAAAEFGADAIVVGAHVTHGGVPKRIGATTRHLLRKLVVPLVVAPAGATRGLGEGGDDNGPLVIGVGHGDATEAAVRWAADLADRRDLGVVLVRATGDGPVFQTDGLLDLISYELHPKRRAEWAERDLVRLAEQVQELSEHDLTIDAGAVPGLAATRLAEASEVASLLVIGQHRSTFTLGRHAAQPLRHLLTHARCPIAVVPEWAGSEPLESQPSS
jgi:nucleotide-binding universal stress UspA family protein